MKTTITKQEYYMLCGLRALATQKNNELTDLVRAVANITGEELDEYDYGHALDFAYSDDTVKALLKKLNIKVV